MNAKHTFVLLASAAMIYSGITSAKFYKSVDEHGNIVYSDTPTVGAEQLTPPPISTVESKPVPKATAEEAQKTDEAGAEEPAKKPPTRYSKFSIVTPQNNATIWDNTGHSVWVYVDGKAMVRKSQSLVQPLSGLDRGAHKIRAEIRDENRKTVKRTQDVTVHLKRASSIPRGGS
jgi:hypothetical protein